MFACIFHIYLVQFRVLIQVLFFCAIGGGCLLIPLLMSCLQPHIQTGWDLFFFYFSFVGLELMSCLELQIETSWNLFFFFFCGHVQSFTVKLVGASRKESSSSSSFVGLLLLLWACGVCLLIFLPMSQSLIFKLVGTSSFVGLGANVMFRASNSNWLEPVLLLPLLLLFLWACLEPHIQTGWSLKKGGFLFLYKHELKKIAIPCQVMV